MQKEKEIEKGTDKTAYTPVDPTAVLLPEEKEAGAERCDDECPEPEKKFSTSMSWRKEYVIFHWPATRH